MLQVDVYEASMTKTQSNYLTRHIFIGEINPQHTLGNDKLFICYILIFNL